MPPPTAFSPTLPSPLNSRSIYPVSELTPQLRFFIVTYTQLMLPALSEAYSSFCTLGLRVNPNYPITYARQKLGYHLSCLLHSVSHFTYYHKSHQS